MERSTNKGLTAICDILTVAGNTTSNILVAANRALAYTTSMLGAGTEAIGTRHQNNAAVRTSKRSKNCVRRFLLLRMALSHTVSRHGAKIEKRETLQEWEQLPA